MTGGLSNFCTGDDACRNPPGAANHAIACPKFPGTGWCAGYEPHPWSIYAEEFCVAPVYVDGRPRYCGRPRKEHAPPPLHVGSPPVVKPIKDER